MRPYVVAPPPSEDKGSFWNLDSHPPSPYTFEGRNSYNVISPPLQWWSSLFLKKRSWSMPEQKSGKSLILKYIFLMKVKAKSKKVD